MSLIDQYKQLAVNAIKSKNPDANPEEKGGVWDVSTTMMGVQGASLQNSQQAVANASFIQNNQGTQLDYSANTLGLPPRQGTTAATVNAITLQPPAVSTTLSAGTLLTSAFNGSIYILVNDTLFLDSSVTTASLESQQTGEGFSLPIGSTLVTAALPNVTFSVTASSDGALSEDDASLKSRIVTTEQNPPGAGRPGQYAVWGFESDTSTVTNVYTVPQFYMTTMTLGVFILVGTADYNDVVLNTTTLYTRQASDESITTASQYIEAERGIGQSFFAGSVATFQPTETIEIQVRLPVGVTLTTTTTNFNGEGITVSDFVKQEFRRGVVSYPLGGTQDIVAETASLLLSRLEQSLDSALSFYSGSLAKLLVDRNILINGIQQDMVVPYNVLDGATNNVLALYDRLPATFTVTILP